MCQSWSHVHLQHASVSSTFFFFATQPLYRHFRAMNPDCWRDAEFCRKYEVWRRPRKPILKRCGPPAPSLFQPSIFHPKSSKVTPPQHLTTRILAKSSFSAGTDYIACNVCVSLARFAPNSGPRLGQAPAFGTAWCTTCHRFVWAGDGI
jgi:hypothetical protein